MKSFTTFFCLAIFLVTAGAFSPTYQSSLSSSNSQRCSLCSVERNLVPSQAKDLEACAYDLMREALEAKARKEEAIGGLTKDISSKLKMEPMGRNGGPVRWCRQRLWPFSGEKNKKLP